MIDPDHSGELRLFTDDDTSDPRSVGGGTVMIHSGYVDQPYCVVNDRMGEIQCTATVGPAHEGGQGTALW